MFNDIAYTSSLAGSGKTYSLIREAAHRVNAGEKIVFSQTTKVLIYKTVNDELNKLPFNVNYEIITGDTVSSVTSEFMERFNSTDEPILLFIMHKGLIDHRQQGHLGGWHLIVDEAPVVLGSEELRLPVTHKLITDYISLSTTDIEKYSLLSIQDKSTIRAISRNKQNDIVYSCVQNLASKIESRHWDVYVKTDRYQAFLNGDVSAFQVFYLLRPPGGRLDPRNLHPLASCLEKLPRLAGSSLLRWPC